MATVDNSPGADTFPTTLEPYLGAVLVRAFEYFCSFYLTIVHDQLAGRFLLW